jgi:DNA topoisomerase-1
VRAQEARRILDRLFGYEVSPLLWRKVRPKLSAGRVQSVAVRLIVERERARMAFVSATYWDLIGRFAKVTQENFQATLSTVDGRKIPSGKDFDSATGRLKDPNLLQMNEQQAQELLEKIRTGEFRVTGVEDKPYTSRPYPPFTTSTLQQEANRKLGFTAKRAMQVAQSLYENGHITYMRTDSTTLAQVAIDAARELVRAEYGPEYLPAEPRVHKSKVKNAQEAHEAIRPAGHPFSLPSALRDKLNTDEFKIFELIWKRTIASQMQDARGRMIRITIEGEGCVFHVSGKVIDFPGYLRAYVEGSDDPNAELADKETVLPDVAVGEQLACIDLESKSHTTQPPARFSEAALTQELEAKGIGRPSTYASIIETIQARGYVFKKANALVPTWVAFSVVQLLEIHLPSLIDYQFTAQMEDDLDSISRGEEEQSNYLRKFYFGNGEMGLKEKLNNKIEEIDARDIGRIRISHAEATDPIFVRVGKYGPFLEQGERRASLPEDLPPDEVTVGKAEELLSQAAVADQPIGVCPATSKPVYIKVGRFGPYVQRGTMEDEEKPQNASLMRGMKVEDIDLETALKLLSLPRTLGEHPETKEPVQAFNGRFGPYVKSGSETRSLGADLSPLDVTLEQALQLLATPKQPGRGRGAKKPPVKIFEQKSPITEQQLQVFDGQYGLYVSDGTTNASLPKGVTLEELRFEQALDLLAERAAAAPKKGRKKATKKKSVAKKAAKKTVKKKPTTKKKSVTRKSPQE